MATNRAAIGLEPVDRRRAALAGFFSGQNERGIPRYPSFRKAYAQFTGDTAANPLQILRECACDYDSRDRLTENVLLSTSWAEVLADVMHKWLVREFKQDANQQWRRIVSTIQPIGDFRTQHLTWYGGFGVLDAVGENGVYQYFETPIDGDETYSLSKRGNLFTVTLEAIANDDSGAIRALPLKMARSAAQTLNRDVFSILTTNGNLGDSVALFHTNSTLRGGDGVTAASGNLASTALASDSLTARRVNMIQRAAQGDATNILGLEPKILVVPPHLEQTAWELTTNERKPIVAENATLKNPHLRQAYEVVCVPWWTDANNWYLLANPQKNPTLQVGFLDGRETPDLVTRNEFTVDRLTYKVSYVYGVGVESWTGFDASVVAG